MEARILQERDTRRYIELRAQAASECPGHVAGDHKEDLFILADHAAAGRLGRSRQDAVVWGAHDGHLLTATLAISRRFNAHVGNHLWLWGLYVRPRYRGTPASRLLMEAMLAWCKGVPVDERLLGSCHGSNRRARLFLSRWGFQLMPATLHLTAIQGIGEGDVLVERERDHQ